MTYEVFLSHSRADAEAAEIFRAGLEDAGIRCWIAPRDIPPGAEWGQAILDGIDLCKFQIVLVTAEAISSPYVRR